MSVPIPLHPLDSVRVATPCHADWDKMQPQDEQGAVRLCQSCRKNVYSLSMMSRDDAWALIRQHEGNICVRFARRADGTLVTGDCPVGVKVRRRKRFAAVSALLALLIPSPVASAIKQSSAKALRAVPVFSAMENTSAGQKIFGYLDPPPPSPIVMGALVCPAPPAQGN